MVAANDQIMKGAPLRERIQILRNQIFPSDKPSPPSSQLRNDLNSWRESRALAADVKPSDVISDEAFEELLARKPKTKTQLERVPQLSTFNVARYGDELISILSEENP